MNDKYNPEAIKQDVENRNPDLPKSSKPTPTQENLKAMLDAGNVQRKEEEKQKNNPLPTEYHKKFNPAVFKATAKYKLDQIYEDKLPEPVKQDLINTMLQDSDEAKEMRLKFEAAPYVPNVDVRKGLLDNMLNLQAKPILDQVNELKNNDSYKYASENIELFLQATKELQKYQEINSQYGLTPFEKEEAFKNRDIVRAFKEDPNFQEGLNLLEQENLANKEAQKIYNNYKSWASKDEKMLEREASLAMYREKALELEKNGGFGTLDNIDQGISAILAGIQSTGVNSVAFGAKALGFDETADAISEKGKNITLKLIGEGKEDRGFTTEVLYGLGAAVGMAKLGQTLSAVGAASGLSAGTAASAGTFLSGYLPTYYDNYVGELAKGKSSKDASSIAILRSTITAMTELVNPNIDVMAGTGTAFTRSVKKLSDFFETSEIDDLLSGSITKSGLNYLKKKVPEIVGEITEEMLDLAGQTAISAFTEEGFDISKKGSELLEEAKQTALITAPITFLLGGKADLEYIYGRKVQNESALTRAIMGSAHSDKAFEMSKGAIELARSNKTITERKADELTNRLTIYREAIAESNLSEKTQTALASISLKGSEEQVAKINEQLYQITQAPEEQKAALGKMAEILISKEAAKIQTENKTNDLKSVFFTENKTPLPQKITNLETTNPETQELLQSATAEIENPLTISPEEAVVPKIKEKISEIDAQTEQAELRLSGIESSIIGEATPEQQLKVDEQKTIIGSLNQRKANLQEDLISAEKIGKLKEEKRKLEETEAQKVKTKIETEEKAAEEKKTAAMAVKKSLVPSDKGEVYEEEVVSPKGEKLKTTVTTNEDLSKTGVVVNEKGEEITRVNLEPLVAQKTTNENFARSLTGFETKKPTPVPSNQQNETEELKSYLGELNTALQDPNITEEAKANYTKEKQKVEAKLQSQAEPAIPVPAQASPQPSPNAPLTNKEKGKQKANQVLSEGKYNNRAEARKAILAALDIKGTKKGAAISQAKAGIEEALDEFFKTTPSAKRKSRALASGKRSSKKNTPMEEPLEKLKEELLQEEAVFAEAMQKAVEEQKTEADPSPLVDFVFSELARNIQKTNPIFYASNNNPENKLQLKMAEYRKSLDAILASMKGSVHQQWLNSSRILATLTTTEQKVEFAKSLRDSIYTEIAALVEAKHNIKLKPVGEIPNDTIGQNSTEYEKFFANVSDEMTIEETEKAVQLYVMQLAEDLSAINLETGKLKAYEEIDKNANNAIKNKKSFVKKSLAVLNRAVNKLINVEIVNENFDSDENEFELINVPTGSDFEKDNVPMEAAVLNGIINAAIVLTNKRTAGKSRPIEVEKTIRTAFMVNKSISQFMEFVEQIQSLKNIPTVQKEILKATSDVLSQYIEEYSRVVADPNQESIEGFKDLQNVSQALKLDLLTTLESMFSMTPEKFTKVDYNKKITAYSINIYDPKNVVVSQISKGLKEIKQWLKDSPELSARYDNVLFIQDLESLWALMREPSFPQNENTLLVKELFASDLTARFYENTLGVENQERIKEFIFDLFSKKEKSISSIKNISILASFITRANINNKVVNTNMPSSKTRVDGKTQSALRRNKVIKGITQKLNAFAQQFLYKETVNENGETIRTQNNTLFSNLLESLDPQVKALYKPENQFNPIIQYAIFANQIQPANVKMINVGRDFELRSPGELERVLTQIAHYSQMVKYGNEKFDMNFFPTNKTDVKGFTVPIIKFQNGQYVVGEDVIIGPNNTGWFIQYAQEILKRIDSNVPVSIVQEHFPEFIKISQVNGALTAEFLPEVLKTQGKNYMRKYIETAAISKMSSVFEAKSEVKQVSGVANVLEPLIEFREQMINELTEAAVNGSFNKKIAELKTEITKGNRSVPNGAYLFLESLEIDTPFTATKNPFQFFQDFVVNQSVNQHYINNTFNPSVDAIVNGLGKTPKTAKQLEKAQKRIGGDTNFTRISTKDAPGIHVPIETVYEVVNIKYPDGTDTIKITMPGVVDKNGNPVVAEYDIFEGVEYISEGYSSAVTTSVGSNHRMAGNLKMTGFGTTKEGVAFSHKSMSVVLTEQLAKENPILQPLYDRMKQNKLDKIVTMSATKSNAELENSSNFEITVENNEFVGKFTTAEINKLTIEPNGLLIQMPVNISQSDAIDSGSRYNKMDIQMMDQLNALMQSPDTKIQEAVNKMLQSLSESIETNGRIANLTIAELNTSISELQQISFESDLLTELTEEQIQKNAQKEQRRARLLRNVFAQIESYEKRLLETTGKEGSAKITKIKEKLQRQLLNPGNPTFSFENAYKEIHEIINDITRDGQTVWVPGGYHSLTSNLFKNLNALPDGTAESKSFKANGETPVVYVNKETATTLGWADGQKVLLTKSPFNNMATKLFAEVKIGAMSGSSMGIPIEWLVLTGSDGDGDAVRSYTINKQSIARFNAFVEKYTQKHAGLTIFEAIKKEQQDIINSQDEEVSEELKEAMKANALLKKYYNLKAESLAQEFLSDFINLHNTEESVKNTQYQKVTVDDYIKAAEKLGFGKQKGNIFDPLVQIIRTGAVKLTQAGIGIGASSSSTIYKLSGITAALQFSKNAFGSLVIKKGNQEFVPGTFNLQNAKLEDTGESMIDPLSNYLQIMVDSFKNNYADFFGLNDSNLVPMLLLAQTGMSQEDQLKIINQPIFKLWAQMRQEESLNKTKNKVVKTYSKEVDSVKNFLVDLILQPNKRIINKEIKAESLNHDNKHYIVNLNSIKAEGLTNKSQGTSELIEVIKNLSPEMLEGQIETFKVLKMLDMQAKSIDSFIKIRKTFQEGETNADNITSFISDLEKAGIIVEDGAEEISKKPIFDYKPMTSRNPLEVQEEIEKIQNILDGVSSVTSVSYGAKLKNDGLNDQTIREALSFRQRLLKAAKINGQWMETLYIGDKIFQAQANNFFNMIAASSQSVVLNKQKIQSKVKASMNGKINNYQHAKALSEWFNLTKLKIARYSLLSKISIGNEPANNVEKAKYFTSFNSIMKDVLEKLYEYRTEIRNGNSFLNNLEFIVESESAPLKTDKNGNNVYLESVFVKNQTGYEVLAEDMVSELTDKYQPIFQELEAIGVIIEDFENINDLKNAINSLPSSFFEGLNADKIGVEFLAGLEFYNQRGSDFSENGVSLIATDNGVYDAITGYFIGNDLPTVKDLGFLEQSEEIGDPITIEPITEEVWTLNSQAKGLMSITGNESPIDAIKAFFENQNKLIGEKGKSKISPRYKPVIQERVNLSQNNTVSNLPFQDISQGLDNLYSDLLETMVEGKSFFDYVFENLDANELNKTIVEQVKQLLKQDEFVYAVLAYQGINTKNFNTYSAYSELLDQEMNRLIDAKIKNELNKGDDLVVNFESVVLSDPSLAMRIEESTMRSLKENDPSLRNMPEYVYVETAEGIILFKKIIKNYGGFETLASDPNKGKQKVEQKIHFYPISHFYGNEKFYIPSITDGAPIDNLTLLGNIDFANLSEVEIMEMITGIFNVNEERIDSPKKIDIESIQKELYGLFSSINKPNANQPTKWSFGSMVNLIDSISFKSALKNIVGFQKVDAAIKNLKVLQEYIEPKTSRDPITGKSKINLMTVSNGAFRNLFYGASVDSEALTGGAFNTEKTIFDISESGIKASPNVLTSQSRVINRANQTSQFAANKNSIKNVLSANNKGQIPVNFKQAINSLVTSVNGNAFFVGISKLLISKVGDAKVVVLTNDQFIELEQNLGVRSNSTNAGESTNAMLYENGEIFVNGDMDFDSKYTTSDFIHEAVHALTVNLYDNDPTFKQDLDRISNAVYASYQNRTNSLAWLNLSIEDAAAIEERIISYHPSQPNGSQRQFALELIAEVFSNGDGTLQELMTSIPSTQPVPSNMLSNLWNQFVFKLSKALGMTNANKGVMGDLLTLLDRNYNRLGFNNPLVERQGASGTYYKQGSRVIKEVKNAVFTALQTTKGDFINSLTKEYNRRIGPGLSDITNLLSKSMQENDELEYLGSLIRLTKKGGQVAVVADRLINQVLSNSNNSRTLIFAANYKNAIANFNILDINQVAEASDYNIAGKIDGISENADGSINVHMLAPDTFDQYLTASMNEEVNNRTNIYSAIRDRRIQQTTPALSILEAGVMAHIKESTGVKVNKIILSVVNMNGGVENVAISYDNIQPYVRLFLQNQNDNRISFAPEVVLAEDKILALEGANLVPDDPDFKATWENLIKEKLKEISNPNTVSLTSPGDIQKGPVRYYSNLIKAFYGDLQNQKYLNLDLESLNKLIAVGDILYNAGYISKNVAVYLRNVGFSKMAGISEQDAIASINKWRNSQLEIKGGWVVTGLEGIQQIITQNFGLGSNMNPINTLLDNLRYDLDETIQEVNGINQKTKDLWAKVLKSNGLKNPNKSQSIDLMKKFGAPIEKNGGETWVFHDINVFMSQNPNQAEQDYYHFAKNQMESILNRVVYGSTGNSPFVPNNELNSFFARNADGELELEFIPMPTAAYSPSGFINNIQYNLSKIGRALGSVFQKRAEKNVLEMLAQGYGGVKVSATDPGLSESKATIHSVAKWRDIIAEGKVNNPNLLSEYEALEQEISQKVKKGELEIDTESFTRFTKSIEHQSFVFGKNLKPREESSYDLQYNMSKYLGNITNLLVASKVHNYMESVGHIMDESLGLNSTDKKNLLGFIEDKYFQSFTKESDTTKFVKNVSKKTRTAAIFYYLGLNVRAQLFDFTDIIGKTFDSGQLKKSILGIKRGIKLLAFQDPADQKNIMENFLSTVGGTNREMIESLIGIDNAFDGLNRFKNNIDKGLDYVYKSVYGLYRYSAFLKMAQFVFSEMEYNEAKSIVTKLKNNQKLSKSEKEKLTLGMDKFIVLAGPFAKSVSIPSESRHWLANHLLTFKQWMIPSFKNKLGSVGNKVGTYTHYPVYSTAYLMAKNFFGKTNEYQKQVLAKMTPEQKKEWAYSFALNVLGTALNMVIFANTYFGGDDDEEKSFNKIRKEAIAYEDQQFKYQLMLLAMTTIGASPLAMIQGLVGIDFITTIAEEIGLKDVPDAGKYIDKEKVESFEDTFMGNLVGEEMTAKMWKVFIAKGPIGNTISGLTMQPDYFWTDTYKEKREKYFENLE